MKYKVQFIFNYGHDGIEIINITDNGDLIPTFDTNDMLFDSFEQATFYKELIKSIPGFDTKHFSKTNILAIKDD